MYGFQYGHRHENNGIRLDMGKLGGYLGLEFFLFSC